MSTNALQRRNCHTRDAEPKTGRKPGEAAQQSVWQFRQQPEGNGCPGAPLFVAFLAQTSSLRFVKRLDWRSMPPVRVSGHSMSRL